MATSGITTTHNRWNRLRSSVVDKNCGGVAQWHCGKLGGYNYCGAKGMGLGNYNSPDECTWTKTKMYSFHNHRYCTTYGYMGNYHYPLSLDEAMYQCANDAKCGGIAQWECGSDNGYNFCGVNGMRLSNYNAKHECTWKKSVLYTYHDHKYCHTYGYKSNKHYKLSLGEAQRQCSMDPKCGGIAQWRCGSNDGYNFCGFHGMGLGNYNAAHECTWVKNTNGSRRRIEGPNSDDNLNSQKNQDLEDDPKFELDMDVDYQIDSKSTDETDTGVESEVYPDAEFTVVPQEEIVIRDMTDLELDADLAGLTVEEWSALAQEKED